MEKFARKCSCCGKGMNNGYHDYGKYYCSNSCLIKGNHNPQEEFTMKTWEQHCQEEPSECYWTEWDEIDNEDFFNAEGVNFYSEEEFEFYNRLKDTHKIIDSVSDELKRLGMEEIEPYISLISILAGNETLLKKFEDERS